VYTYEAPSQGPTRNDAFFFLMSCASGASALSVSASVSSRELLDPKGQRTLDVGVPEE